MFYSAALAVSSQLEMVKAFRRLVDGGTRDWTLHLVGGCEAIGRPYLEKVQQAAQGYPVQIHVDASGEELASLYAEASIYWHASGMGENPDRHPGRLEHFGMTTVEAMSAGAVPVVIGLAGQLETVVDGVSGHHISNVRELAERTSALIDDPSRRAEMSARAEERARSFSIEAFGERFWELADEVFTAGGEGQYGPARP
jgi:glycosyltransferase involved in cell wall biosynthesis